VRRRKPERPHGPDETEGAAEALDEASCRERAVALLARREHGRTELARKLTARGYDENIVAAALARLEREGALADERFTAGFVRGRALKGKGPVRIRAELAERGIDKGEARKGLEASDVDWAAEAAAVRRKRFGPAPPHDFKERARQARFLEYRGFEPRHIEAALSATASEEP
jgi:regulatory protein